MKTWTERRCWHILSSLLLLLGPGITLIWVGADQPGPVIFLLGSMTLIVSLALLAFSHPRCSESWGLNLYAVLEKRTNKIVAYHLYKVWLRPFPFMTKHYFKSYPASFEYSSPLGAITSNPKVVPLQVSVSAKLFDAPDMEEFTQFVLQPAIQKKAENEFLKHVFEAVHHRMPQALAERVNPYDSATVQEFIDYVAQEVNPSLPLGYKIDSVRVYHK